MTIETTTDDVPAELRELYRKLLHSADVNRAVGAYWSHDADPTPEGADAVRHREALVLADRRREANERGEAFAAAIQAASTCPSCGGSMGIGVTRSGLCSACARVDIWLDGQQLAAEPVGDTTRGDLVATFRKDRTR